MSTSEPVRVCIAADREAVPVTGRVIPERGAERQFTGWMELFAALQVVLVDGGEEGDPGA